MTLVGRKELRVRHYLMVFVLWASVTCLAASAQSSWKQIPKNLEEMQRVAEEAHAEREKYILDQNLRDAQTLDSFDGCRSSLPQEQRARILQQVPVEYPDAALNAGQEGRVLVCVAVSPTGEIERLGVIRSSLFPALDEAALKSIASWTFTPATDASGNAIRDVLHIGVKFHTE
jgi:TonB family protein